MEVAHVVEHLHGRARQVDVEVAPHEVADDHRILVEESAEALHVSQRDLNFAELLSPFQQMFHRWEQTTEIVPGPPFPGLSILLSVKPVFVELGVLHLEDLRLSCQRGMTPSACRPLGPSCVPSRGLMRWCGLRSLPGIEAWRRGALRLLTLRNSVRCSVRWVRGVMRMAIFVSVLWIPALMVLRTSVIMLPVDPHSARSSCLGRRLRGCRFLSRRSHVVV